MSDVPFVDLSRQHGQVAAHARSVFDRVMMSGAFILGGELEAFEAEFADYCGAAHCVGVGNGTDALKLALEAMGVGPGGEVVTAAMTFVATVEAIAANGARPVLVDVDPATRNIDPAAVAAALGPETKAVVPVHLYGRPAPMGELAAACAAGGVSLLEDAAQAHGATLDGRRAGALGTAAAFSFYPTKNLGAMGDGGAVTTDDAGLAEVVRALRHHGSEPDDANRHVRAGWTARLDNLQAALLRLKLPHLAGWNRERREAAERYREALDGLEGVTLPPPDPEGGTQVFHLFVVEVDDRDRVLARLREDGIGAAVHYPAPVHLQPAWSALGEPGAFPAAERLAQRALTLPVFPGITPTEVDRAAGALRTAVAAAASA
jgi:dTDP-4-amino-4,6-dideoxygalactose transaminase